MKKTKHRIKRFLSSVRPASEKDENYVRFFFNSKKVGVKPPNPYPGFENLDTVTYEQVMHWYESNIPGIGAVIKCEKTGQVMLVTSEKWDSFIVGATLSPDKTLSLEQRHYTDEQYVLANENERLELQMALAREGYDWSPSHRALEPREIPVMPRFVRLFTLEEPVGYGIFKEVLPDRSLVMYCIKFEKGRFVCEGETNLGDVDGYSFMKTYTEHRAAIHEELGEAGYVWNSRCYRLEKQKTRARMGKKYYHVNNYLQVKEEVESDSSSDNLRYVKGNYFLSRAVAERARNRIIDVCKEEIVSEDNC